MTPPLWTAAGAHLDPGVAQTRVDYPGGGVRGTGTVVGVARLTGPDGDALGVVLDRTAAHPVSPTWPDQPADRGTLSAATDLALIDVRQGVVTADGLVLDAPRAVGTAVVVHLVDAAAPIAVGDVVTVTVDEAYRRALSLAHSACHLTALALDAALAPFWTKPAPVDPLGHPAFDQLAITSSRLTPFAAVDTYRLGKSLRRKGFDAARLAAELPAVAAAHAATLQRWVAADVPLGVDAGDGTLTARRTWRCVLDGTDVALPCGGTHATSTGELAGISATHRLAEALDELVVTTTLPG